MAVLSSNNPTIVDLARATDPDGSIADVVQMAAQTNEILSDMTVLNANLPTAHRTTVCAGLPEPTWRKLYGFVQPSTSKMTQVDESMGMMEAYAEIDKALADLSGNVAAYRLMEERNHIEGLNKAMAEALFHANEKVHPERFTGFSPRFNSLSANNRENIISGGGSGSDNASIWLVVWSPNTCHGIVPKGSTAGLQRVDKGQVTVQGTDGDNGRMEAYRTHYRWDMGLCVRDWRYVVRIANIDRSNLSATFTNGAFAGNSANLPDLLHQAFSVLPSMSMGRPALYMDRQVLGFLRRQVSAAISGSTLTMQNVGGTMQTNFMEVPIRRCDALSVDEAAIT